MLYSIKADVVKTAIDEVVRQRNAEWQQEETKRKSSSKKEVKLKYAYEYFDKDRDCELLENVGKVSSG